MGDLAGDGAEGLEGGSEVFGEQVGWESACDAFAYLAKVFGGLLETMVVAAVGQQYGVFCSCA